MRLGDNPREVTLINPRSAFGWMSDETLVGASLTSKGNATAVSFEGCSEVGENIEVGEGTLFSKYVEEAGDSLLGSVNVFDVYPRTKWVLIGGRISYHPNGLYLINLDTSERVMLLDQSEMHVPYVQRAKFSLDGNKLAVATSFFGNGKVKRKILIYEVLDMGHS